MLGSSSIEVFATENGEEPERLYFPEILEMSTSRFCRDPIYTQSGRLCCHGVYIRRQAIMEMKHRIMLAELAEIIERTFARGGNVVSAVHLR